MRVFFSNLGCKLNQAELERMARDFAAAGHEVVASLEEADLHVVNSCTVTHRAARDSRKLSRRGRHRPELRTVLTGCYATGSREEAAALAGVDLVVGNEHKDRLLEVVHRELPEVVPTERTRVDVPVSYVPLAATHSRAAVKVEDGCNMRCSFCIIPFTRGQQRSRPVDEVVAEVRTLAAAGIEEVIVTGVQISSYRQDEERLPDLVAALLERTSLPRFRLTSIAPWQFDDRLFDLLRSDRICRHVHLSLQSGCDATLERMRRPYGAERFASLVARLRREIPGIAITTDVIVGFPGESDAEFDESLAFVEAMAFARVHAFSYSRREGTRASEMPDEVPVPVKKERMSRMLAAAEHGSRDFARSQLGQTLEVLWEDQRDGRWRGTTDNYLRVSSATSPGTPRGRARLERLRHDGVAAVPVPDVAPRHEARGPAPGMATSP